MNDEERRRYIAKRVQIMGRFVEAMNFVAPCPSCGGPDGAQPPEHGAEHAPGCLFADAADAWDDIKAHAWGRATRTSVRVCTVAHPEAV